MNLDAYTMFSLFSSMQKPRWHIENEHGINYVFDVPAEHIRKVHRSDKAKVAVIFAYTDTKSMLRIEMTIHGARNSKRVISLHNDDDPYARAYANFNKIDSVDNEHAKHLTNTLKSLGLFDLENFCKDFISSI